MASRPEQHCQSRVGGRAIRHRACWSTVTLFSLCTHDLSCFRHYASLYTHTMPSREHSARPARIHEQKAAGDTPTQDLKKTRCMCQLTR